MSRWHLATGAHVGAAAELIVAAEFALWGYRVFRPLVDDRGVDLLVDLGSGRHLLVQVKSVRGSGYVYMRKTSFSLDEHRALALLVFPADANYPELFLIPASAWRNPIPPFADRDYVDKKSDPEYGLSINKQWRRQLEQWRVMPGERLPVAFPVE
ncbi:hypothetical protein [Microbispora triticiradicis]|uniref:hypothetical protein n=1 Tax=Microbispora triticiradicis TaxID=2200763 RepID=UPI001AD6EF22|nr:hypothetical protein [Microbispora triticiradicis]MBO4272718.1 DUF4365 domain-containing protein [Microbispora triticiradicis]